MISASSLAEKKAATSSVMLCSVSLDLLLNAWFKAASCSSVSSADASSS